MHRFPLSVATVFMVVGWSNAATAQSVCGGTVLFQCATDSADFREQITVCARDRSYALTRHALSSGDKYYDAPLIADANTTWFRWSEDDQVQLEIGFWSTDLAEPVTLHMELPWDDMTETVAETGSSAMWLQSPHWRDRVDQTTCASETVYADPEGLWAAQHARGPIAAFFSQDEIIPRVDTVGMARVTDMEATAEGVPVYASARPGAATPIWWMLQPGETVDIIDLANEFIAVAIPTNGLTGCFLRPEDLGRPYTGPCATGWVDGAYLQRTQ
ncbi:hypothetical protein [Phaeobacter gallaeciensis]|uniref:hypothetical protein n=1 Tax=Phaeobacter gallaeciensis TaxID=60890 RepID=UPI00237FCA39|nr:hypothetical protein [Phaeobacter gallaeciensis]MEE2818339.1 hypothetical protein [Pseudomonadota bacterium]MDE4140674.1 hypothetical protein [Phaeobacter gallaeciensis]MDE4149119.1 hypothetical protein [Phaeobacter gallaeciensis]MDE4153688.1 hypothetical protein [Phaeobacter gallaeciensis]MDE4229079.1 hypothetical protein [Phaeobacter gallaeciensis]